MNQRVLLFSMTCIRTLKAIVFIQSRDGWEIASRNKKCISAKLRQTLSPPWLRCLCPKIFSSGMLVISSCWPGYCVMDIFTLYLCEISLFSSTSAQLTLGHHSGWIENDISLFPKSLLPHVMGKVFSFIFCLPLLMLLNERLAFAEGQKITN